MNPPHSGLIVIPFKLFLDMVPESSADNVTRHVLKDVKDEEVYVKPLGLLTSQHFKTLQRFSKPGKF